MNISSFVKRFSLAVVNNNKSEIEEICFELEISQLNRENWSQEVFSFFSEALKDKAACRVAGSSCLVLSLYNDFEKLTQSQNKELLKIFEDYADEFDDEMLRHSVSDMIARKYPIKEAMEIFQRWQKCDSSKRLHMAQVGLEVLIMAGRAHDEVERKARDILKLIINR